MIDCILGVIGSWLICVIAAERLAELITTAKVFAPMRSFLASMAMYPQQYKTKLRECASSNAIWGEFGASAYATYSLLIAVCKPFKFLSDLTSCGWCTSAWTSFVVAWFLPHEHSFIGQTVSTNIIIQALGVFGLANLYHAVFRIVHRGRVGALDLTVRLVEQDSPQQEPEQQETFELSAEPKNGV